MIEVVCLGRRELMFRILFGVVAYDCLVQV